jgi:hypothetical protein
MMVVGVSVKKNKKTEVVGVKIKNIKKQKL